MPQPTPTTVIPTSPAIIRTSSCSKEEVDAILIQCGRLSRSSSGKANTPGSRKYSGSKRSFDFDKEAEVTSSEHHSRPSHRRTTSRDKRSISRDRDEEKRRNGSSSSRRVSRSPGRRNEVAGAALDNKSRPGKMVSVPARDKTIVSASSNPDSAARGNIKRVSVKRSGEVSGSRTAAASPRSQSPANVRPSNENTQPSLSRNSSRKADHSPYRRNPMTEIDDNCIRTEQLALKSQAPNKPTGFSKNKAQRTKDYQEPNEGAEVVKGNGFSNKSICALEEAKGVLQKSIDPHTITRSRSSRDLDDANNVPPTSYTSLLLEDIQNFHHQNTTAFTLPPCVTKACSILDAVADLNSCNGSNLSNKNVCTKFIESEVIVSDDIVEPSFHKYITVRRSANEGEMEQQESSGSNSIAGQHWVSSSLSWEHNSADSTDHLSSRSNSREEEPSLLVCSHNKQAFCDVVAGEKRLKSSTATRLHNQQRVGIGRGKVGVAASM
ncbi:hypothetical protein GIB67_003628 [Kingdonia uniflora]|nr:hypothetical protein GIB67_003628 [Kingdonia uniflora]